MPSRRRSRSKNLNNNLADVQRRLRYLERRPVRTKLANRVVARAAIAPNAVSADEAEFGTAVVVEPGDTIAETKAEIENPKDGLLVVDSNTGESQIYSENQDTYYDVSDPVAQGSADAAANAAVIANNNAALAKLTADGKNKVFRQTSQPTTGPFAEGDLWFDTDDDNKIYRYTSGSWNTAVELGNNALASISATKVTAGQLQAGVVYAGNIVAGQITAGDIAVGRLTASVINAVNLSAGFISADKIGAGSITASISISGPTITGGTIQTAADGRRIVIQDSDDIVFYGLSGGSSTRFGTITSVGGTFPTGGSYDADGNLIPGTTTSLNNGIMIYGGGSVISDGATTYPSLVATSTQVNMYGASNVRFQAASDGLGMYGPKAYIYPDITTIFTGYSTTGSEPWHLYLQGRLRLSENPQGPLSQGSGAPTSNGAIVGQVVFRYT